MEKPTLHLLGLFHTCPTAKYSHCAFTGKALRFSKMMKLYGYRVIEYANGNSESEADEKVMILPESVMLQLSGRIDEKESSFVGPHAVIGSALWKAFEEKLNLEVVARAKEYDIICHPFGPRIHTTLVSKLPKCYHIETGIGYPDPWLDYKIFESSAWMHCYLGKEQKSGQNYNWVVPNYYDLEEWDVCLKPQDYIIFLGRITEEKGMCNIVEIAKRTDKKLIICGQGNPEKWLKECNKIIYKPPVKGRERNSLLGNAYCCIMPSLFVEPFAGAGVEAMLCGTPLLGSNYGAFQETIIHGVTGFRCNTLGDWLNGIIAVKTLDRAEVARITRSRYSLETCGKMYDIIFKNLSDLKQKGWYTEHSYALQGEIARKLEAEDMEKQLTNVKLYHYKPRIAAIRKS